MPLHLRMFMMLTYIFCRMNCVRRYRRLLSHFHREVKHPNSAFIPPKLSHTIPIIGFSATFSRHDGLALGSVFERIVYHRDFLEMIKEQWCHPLFLMQDTAVD